MKISTHRFYLRELTENDVGSRYLSWLQDKETAEFITYKQKNLDELTLYVKTNLLAKDVLFLGVFCKCTDEHIGNLKFDKIINHSAVMGVLIGQANWRGCGVATEILPASIEYLYREMNIDSVYLGVERDNTPAISVYDKVGFLPCTNQPFSLGDNGLAMVHRFL
ncbi:hypothetical protein GCM10009111_13990 [Colwellia asteriadis]|uniref:N-acetyltransferase domain-containing protein n=1 Tax=Colwellia asteriadis TaxID=517723 RepID=A0ABN1L6F8_9GAMM